MKIIELPREGMQGLEKLVPTENKVEYIQSVLKVGFDVVETGSIVSPKLIPQMADSLEVLGRLDLQNSKSQLMMLTVSRKGADIAAERDELSFLSYPFSFSAEFLRRNMNTTVDDAFGTFEYILNLCAKKNKTLVTYISMAFGSPYNEPWDLELLLSAADRLQKAGARIITLSNVSIPVSPERLSDCMNMLIHELPCVEFGLHLHTFPGDWKPAVQAAYREGCRRFDTVISGLGGCPMTGEPLLGNLNPSDFIGFARSEGEAGSLDLEAFANANRLANLYFQ
jgi:hydroxymethylglutaryl-CoA lyase